ncbi:MAG: phytoene dehydrogenase, partial [Chloroflexi bacterium]|nr:phytoene dehydrogenase [Chloroflexota bacterium]
APQRGRAIPVIHPERGVSRRARSDLPAPLHLSRSLAAYRHLGRLDKLRVVRSAAALARLDLGDRSLDAQTFGRWLQSYGVSSRALESFWDLIVLPTLNLPSDEASLWQSAMVFQVGLLTSGPAADLGYTTVPLGEAHGERAAAALAASGVDVRLNTAVSAIERPAGEDVRVRVSGERIAASALVLAVPHDQASRLVPAEVHADAESFADLGHSPIVNLHVIYDRPVMDHAFAAGVGTPVQWVFDRSAAAGLTMGQCLAVSLSGATAYAARPTEELRAMFLPELARLFPSAAEARVTAFYVTREHRATFRPSPGALRLRPRATTADPRIALAGAWTDTGWPATMEGAVRSGRQAARSVLLALGRERDLPTAA